MLPDSECNFFSGLRANDRLRNLLDDMKPRAVLFLGLFYGLNPSTKRSELAKFLLNCLQTFMPVTMSNLSLGFIPISTPILLVQPLNLGNLHTETPDLCP
jgi:hypothetical protein